jgi:multicomponent Na+:H+ antiporter subunit C
MIEPAFVLITGLFAAAGIYLILSRALIRMVIGVVLLGNAVNLLIFVAGRLSRGAPPILPGSGSVRAADIVNPLPQALILTAIVIGFAMFAFLAALALRAYQQMDADDTDHMRLTEPDHQPQPPLEY